MVVTANRLTMCVQTRPSGLGFWLLRSVQRIGRAWPKPSCFFISGSNKSISSREVGMDDMFAQCGLDTCIPMQPRCGTPMMVPKEADSSTPLIALSGSSKSLRSWKDPVEVTNIEYDLDDIILQDLIGKGTNGSVYRAQLNGNSVAVKILIWHSGSYSERDQGPDPFSMLEEMKVLQQASHPNLVSIHGVHVSAEDWDWDNSNLIDTFSLKSSLDSTPVSDESVDPHIGREVRAWVVMEYCDRGNVWESTLQGEFHIGGNLGTPKYSMITEVALEVAFGMRHLHTLDVVHGNLKAANILLQSSDSSKKNFKVKLGGFSQCGRPRSNR